MTLPADVRQYPDAIAQALSQLRLVGVNGPYSVVLGADAYTALAETVDNGYPVLEHIKKLVKDEIIWAPAIDGAFVLTTRGGDFDLHIGQDVSIGYLSHTDSAVRLYLQETLTFLMLTSEAAVALAPPKRIDDLRTNSPNLSQSADPPAVRGYCFDKALAIKSMQTWPDPRAGCGRYGAPSQAERAPPWSPHLEVDHGASAERTGRHIWSPKEDQCLQSGHELCSYQCRLTPTLPTG